MVSPPAPERRPGATRARWLVRKAIWATPAVAALALLFLDAPLRSSRPLLATTLWVALILLSWLGWGSALAILLFPRRRLDWGLRAALGMATVLMLGGILGAARLVSSASILTLVALGLAALGLDAIQYGKIDVRRAKAF